MLWMPYRASDWSCDFFNSTWLAFTGRTLSKSVAAVGPRACTLKTSKTAWTVICSVSSNARRFVLEYRLRRADGDYGWILDYGVPRYGQAGLSRASSARASTSPKCVKAPKP